MRQEFLVTLTIAEIASARSASAQVAVPAWAKTMAVYASPEDWGSTSATIKLDHKTTLDQTWREISGVSLVSSADFDDAIDVTTVPLVRARCSTAGGTGSSHVPDADAKVVFVFAD